MHATKRVISVCRKTNWDYLGFIASLQTVLFAHEEVRIPPALEGTLSVVRHGGEDSYLNLHNKTLSIMNHVHQSGEQWHFFKQDDEAVIFWPHFNGMKQCKLSASVSTCW